MNLLTLAEAAASCRVSVTTLRTLWREEGFPVIQVSQRRYGVDPDAMRAWLAGRTVAPWRTVRAANGAPAASTPSKAADTGASQSRFPRIPSESVDARNGSSAQRRPPNGSSTQSNVVLLADSRQRSQR